MLLLVIQGKKGMEKEQTVLTVYFYYKGETEKKDQAFKIFRFNFFQLYSNHEI